MLAFETAEKSGKRDRERDNQCKKFMHFEGKKMNKSRMVQSRKKIEIQCDYQIKVVWYLLGNQHSIHTCTQDEDNINIDWFTNSVGNINQCWILMKISTKFDWSIDCCSFILVVCTILYSNKYFCAFQAYFGAKKFPKYIFEGK